jgi:hypothetical protein
MDGTSFALSLTLAGVLVTGPARSADREVRGPAADAPMIGGATATERGARPTASGVERTAHGVLGAIVGAVGAMSVGMAIFFLTRVESDESAAHTITTGVSPSACRRAPASAACASLDGAYSSQQSDAAWTIALAGIGVGALVSGAVIWFWPERPVTGNASAPPLGPVVGGVAWKGTF